MEQEGIVCAECGTMNEPGWSFCQQCGKRLTKSAAPPVASEAPADLKTIPEQHAVVDPMIDGLKTNPEPQPAERSYKTVVAQPPPFEPPSKPIVEERPREEPRPAPRHPLPAAPPTVVARPPLPEPAASEPDISTMRSAPAESPVQPKPTAPTPPPPVQQKPAAVQEPPAPKPSTPPPPTAPSSSAPEPKVAPMSGVLCTQCGQSNTVGSAFCASCGAPMTFGQTMVISSQAAPAKGRLHLVMEGGQPGEIYELSDDTVIGRTNGDITFPHDGFMSGRHARIEQRGASFILTDEASRNGTFIKLKDEVELKPGDMILVGKQLFRFELEK